MIKATLPTQTTNLTNLIFYKAGTALAAQMILIGIVLHAQTAFRTTLILTTIHAITADITFFPFLCQKAIPASITEFTAIYTMCTPIKTPAGIFHTGVTKLAVILFPAIFTHLTVRTDLGTILANAAL